MEPSRSFRVGAWFFIHLPHVVPIAQEILLTWSKIYRISLAFSAFVLSDSFKEHCWRSFCVRLWLRKAFRAKLRFGYANDILILFSFLFLLNMIWMIYSYITFRILANLLSKCHFISRRSWRDSKLSSRHVAYGAPISWLTTSDLLDICQVPRLLRKSGAPPKLPQVGSSNVSFTFNFTVSIFKSSNHSNSWRPYSGLN